MANRDLPYIVPHLGQKRAQHLAVESEVHRLHQMRNRIDQVMTFDEKRSGSLLFVERESMLRLLALVLRLLALPPCDQSEHRGDYRE